MMFWNVENFFDYRDGGYSSSDKEFSSRGSRHWTKRKFEAKIDGIAKTVLWCGAPDAVGLAEVENSFVLKKLCSCDILRKLGYSYVHYESRDPRGIDVALLYRPDRLELVSSRPVPVDTLATRDILYVCLRDRSDGELWHILVNHHPSKYGGRTSEGRRRAAMLSLKHCVDSIAGACSSATNGISAPSRTLNIVAAGDFNDTPDAEAFSIVDGTLINLGAGLNTGTIRFRGNWELIDNFLVSPTVAGKKKMEVLRPPFLLERDRSFPGLKPLRTWLGPRYNGGVSDHLPILLNSSF